MSRPSPVLAYAVLSSADTVLAALSPDAAGRLRRLTKPLLMPMLAWSMRSRRSGADRVMMQRTLAGLGLSAVGDIALLRHDDVGLLRGLRAFLAAHLAYICAFSHRGRWVAGSGTAKRLVPLAVVWASVLPTFARRAGSLRAPVFVYGTVLAAMQASALLLDDDVPAAARTRIARGAACFLVSDALLAAGRFLMPRGPGARHHRLDEAAVMATYTFAQWLIVDGVVRTEGRGSRIPVQ